jgi:hypothetical protein
MKRPLRIASASNAMDLQEEPGASFPDRRGLGPAMRRDSRMLMQRPEALLNHRLDIASEQVILLPYSPLSNWPRFSGAFC